MRILITGIAGFIGFHTAQELLQDTNNFIVGIDNFCDIPYDSSYKWERVKHLNAFTMQDIQKLNSKYINKIESSSKNITLYNFDLSTQAEILDKIVQTFNPDVLIHYAAIANPRYSLHYPNLYVQSNILGFTNVLNSVSKFSTSTHIIFTSSSSVYSDVLNDKDQSKFKSIESLSSTENQSSIYSATKKCDEIIANTYSKIFNLKITCLRPFTVYGPFSRPDKFINIAISSIQNHIPIHLYNNGNNYRDFTYIDDFIRCVKLLIQNPSNQNNNSNYKTYNIGSENPIQIKFVLSLIEKFMNDSTIVFNKPAQNETAYTFSDMSLFYNDYNYKPNTKFEVGLKSTIQSYLQNKT